MFLGKKCLENGDLCMEKKLDIKYNIPAIKAFLNIFDLTLEDIEEVVIGGILKVIRDNKEVGVVKFNDGEIEVNSNSKYGMLTARTLYANSFSLTDMESLDSIGMIGLYASWFNNFMFSLDNKITGDLNFGVKIDNEDKKYTINFQKYGYNLYYLEESKDYQKKIIYDLFDSFTHSYIQHSIIKNILDNGIVKKHYEGAFIGKSYDNKENNTADNFKDIDNKLVDKKHLEFPKKGKDNDEDEVINKGEVFATISPNMQVKIKSLIEEYPFLEKIFMYAFTNYSEKEVYALFGLNKNNIRLNDFYFDKEKIKLLVKNVF